MKKTLNRQINMTKMRVEEQIKRRKETLCIYACQLLCLHPMPLIIQPLWPFIAKNDRFRQPCSLIAFCIEYLYLFSLHLIIFCT